MFKRFVGIRAEDMTQDKDGLTSLNVLASTDRAVSWGSWREVLKHDAGSIDYSAASALLINHDNNQIAGALREYEIGSGSMRIRAELDDSATLQSGMKASRAVAIGALRGASIGYSYEREDADYDEGTRTVTVRKWRLLELSLTPTPADESAGIRSCPFDSPKPPATAPAQERTMSTAAPAAPAAPVNDPKPSADDLVAAARAEAGEIAALARSVDLDAAPFVGLAKADAHKAILEEVAKRTAEAHKAPKNPVVPSATITVEETDKHRDAFADAFAARIGMGKVDAGNPYAGRKLRQMAARFARQQGVKTDDWSDRDEAHFALGELSQVRGLRDAANITTGSFPSFVFLNALTKITAKGFEMAPKGLVGPSGAAIYDTQRVPDFKSYNLGGMGTANLIETAEDVAFPELTKAEGVYSNTAKMWGGTLSLTIQALVSDDTAAFDRSLRQIGPICQKTIEKRIVQKLLMGTSSSTATSTWTGNTTSGCTPVFTTADTVAAARANVGKANAALMVKTGLDGNPTGNMMRFFVAGPTAGGYLAALLNQAPGQIVLNGNLGQGELVITPWLENSALTGYSTTSYYVVADPTLVTGLVLSMIAGYDNPQVQEYDAGAVGARKWKFWMPFEADLFYTSVNGTNTIFGAQQATT